VLDRRRLLLGSLFGLSTPGAARAFATTPQARDIDRLGKFELVVGRPGIVVGVPHGTPDVGTLDIGRTLRERLGAGGVFVTGFWDRTTRERINVNRPTEQVIGPESKVVRQWPSERAAAANARYEALVKEAAQGRLEVFYEIHSNHRPQFAGSIEVSTLGVRRDQAARLKAAFDAARDRLAPDVPRLAMHVSPIDKVTYPDYRAASTISRLSERGCAIEAPGRVLANRPWRLAYAACLAEAIGAARWG
jgi:hypothetical protein